MALNPLMARLRPGTSLIRLVRSQTTTVTVVTSPADGTGQSNHAANPDPSTVPWPGSTFIIREISTGHVITLIDGHVVLASADAGCGSTRWECVESKGWLGFRNTVSGRFLGHSKGGTLQYMVEKHLHWDCFVAMARPEGGFVLLMKHWERLWHVGIRLEHGTQKLAKLDDGGSGGVVWEFVKV